MKRMVTREELQELTGQELGVSGWLLVDQSRIDSFAHLTGDQQWIHVDAERAGREIGGTIAHGLLTLSLLPAMAAEIWAIEGATSTLNYGFERIRFTAAVPSGASVRLRETLLKVEPRAGALLITRHCVVELQGGDKPALVADWLGLCRFT